MTCVCTPRYSFLLNGSMFGFLEGRRGIRQRDRVSPLLFVICMEYLTRVIRFVGMKLNHLCFTNDVILCCKGEFVSVCIQCSEGSNTSQRPQG